MVIFGHGVGRRGYVASAVPAPASCRRLIYEVRVMAPRLRAHLSTIVVAFVTAAVTAGGPAVAASIVDYARNADKVDGRHAVGAGTSAANRAGKLVATNGDGRLPNGIITKAPDANRLDGLDSSSFLRANGTAAEADTLDGLDSKNFTQSGTVSVTEGPAGWVPSSTVEPVVYSRNDRFAVTRNSAGISDFQIPISLPAVVHDWPMSLTSVRVCFAGVPNAPVTQLSTIVMHTDLDGTVHNGGIGGPANFDSHTGPGCVDLHYWDPVDLQPGDHVVVGARGTWAVGGATMELGSVTLTLEPTAGGIEQPR
jgi:hypothetical protein